MMSCDEPHTLASTQPYALVLTVIAGASDLVYARGVGPGSPTYDMLHARLRVSLNIEQWSTNALLYYLRQHRMTML